MARLRTSGLSIIKRLRRASRVAINKSLKAQEAFNKSLQISSRLNREIHNAVKSDSEMASQLIIEYILHDIRRERNLTARKYIWRPHSNITTDLQNLVMLKLKEDLGFNVESYCGHGHSGWITGRDGKSEWERDVMNCNGTTYNTCWREVSISW